MKQIEYACKDVVFHFNKKHLEDQTIPMWVLKTAGETFDVNHVDCEMPWSTKETPDNSHTKGSLKLKDALMVIDENNNAKLTKLTVLDKLRLRNQKLGITRVLFRPGTAFVGALKAGEFKHSPFKSVVGGCGTTFLVCDLLDKKQAMIASLKYSSDFQTLAPNHEYYQKYDSKDKYISLDPADYEDDDYYT